MQDPVSAPTTAGAPAAGIGRSREELADQQQQCRQEEQRQPPGGMERKHCRSPRGRRTLPGLDIRHQQQQGLHSAGSLLAR